MFAPHAASSSPPPPSGSGASYFCHDCAAHYSRPPVVDRDSAGRVVRRRCGGCSSALIEIVESSEQIRDAMRFSPPLATATARTMRAMQGVGDGAAPRATTAQPSHAAAAQAIDPTLAAVQDLLSHPAAAHGLGGSVPVNVSQLVTGVLAGQPAGAQATVIHMTQTDGGPQQVRVTTQPMAAAAPLLANLAAAVSPDLQRRINAFMQEAATSGHPERPTPQPVLDSLPKFKHGSPEADAVPIPTAGDGAQCTVCLEEYEEGAECIGLPCGHRFHIPCATQWLEKHNTCPSCRHELPRGI